MVASRTDLTGLLRVLAYEDSFPDEYIGPFLQAHPNLRFEHIPYDTDAQSNSMLAGGIEPDVVAACVEESLALVVAGGHLQPLDPSRIPSWDHLFPIFKGLPGVVAGGEVWMVPVDSAPTGLMFDTTRGPAPTSFGDLFRVVSRGPVAVDAKPMIALHVGALAMGIQHPPAMSLEQLESVTDFFLDLKRSGRFPYLWATHGDIERLFRERLIVASTGFPGDTRDLQRVGLPVDFAIAAEGPMLWACGFGLGSRCRNEDAAYAFLEFVLDPVSQGRLAADMDFMVSNTQTARLATADVRARAHLDAPLRFGESDLPEPPVHYAAWLEAWQRILDA
jgi:spermidine/putrescine-binding protein